MTPPSRYTHFVVTATCTMTTTICRKRIKRLDNPAVCVCP
jgi:hypothetical protein